MNNIRVVLIIVGVFFLVSCAGCSSPAKPEAHSKPRILTSEIKQPVQKVKKQPELAVSSWISRFKGITPSHISIPAVHIEARIEPVGFLENGQMDVPNRTDRVGYLASGVFPGAAGNAIMDGHVDTYTGPAVFYPLKKLKKGDSVYISNDNGDKLRFIVQSVNYYLTEDAPAEAIFGPSSNHGLNLITCAGRYSRSRREDEGRLVVYTRLYSSKHTGHD
ncbi:class F sortase [Paenibacillus sp. SN-8-1]|uniref:class F sortase n=1 Tax=Paenibacillus sp. SN-8-1 TaxID=3435409 RepID=UPI003D9A330F